MKVSKSWLCEYVSIKSDTNHLADALTMAGLEIESISDPYDYLKTVVVGKIRTISPHPNADKLQCCRVDIGETTIPVVCGAKNIYEGALTACALPGTCLPNGLVLKKTVLRGEPSEGMICSETELGIGDAGEGILILEGSHNPGCSLNETLNLSDAVLEIGLTPNRPDCASMIGVAREIAAIESEPLSQPEITLEETGPDCSTMTSVKIENPDHCPRYAARVMLDVQIAPSPIWLQQRLQSIGLRPINNVVDITNFVMMETGQPLHAFDYDLLEENRIVVRTARQGEKFTTLDKKERTMESDMLFICDGKKPVAVAGVMGGLNSEIHSKTQRVLLESAYFQPTSVRKTSKRLGLSTDASYRFERGIDPDGVILAINRTAQLMKDICGATLCKGIVDVYPNPLPAVQIELSIQKTHQLIGITPDREQVKTLLKSIGFKVNDIDDDRIQINVPSHRVDIQRPQDIMEEVARLVGYNSIPIVSPKSPIQVEKQSLHMAYRQIIKQVMTGLGFSEAINYSFIASDSADRLSLTSDDRRRQHVELLNPISEDQAVMRTSLVPGMLETVRHNLNQKNIHLKLFESGKVFLKQSNAPLPEERESIVAIWTGAAQVESWQQKERICDFYDLKGIIESLMNALHIKKLTFNKPQQDVDPYFRIGYVAEIMVKQNKIGLLGEIHPEVLNAYQIKQPVYLFEIDYETLYPLIPEKINARPLPRYPATERDMTLILDKKVHAKDIIDVMKSCNEKLVSDIQIFSVYDGAPISEGKKSMSFRITFRSWEETLKDEKINQIHTDIANTVIKTFNAGLP
ncbi:phenylalanyl-tRNA synthetase subunit beta [Candidatus Magnetomorum sp. HK-1]|nr:phenylalanyl-tRNA synthetase subunit beta [Candidatus Magnetomorum sp. HK-1]